MKRSFQSKDRPVLGCFALVKALNMSGRVLSSPRATRVLEASVIHLAIPRASEHEEARKNLPNSQHRIKGCTMPCRHMSADV